MSIAVPHYNGSSTRKAADKAATCSIISHVSQLIADRSNAKLPDCSCSGRMNIVNNIRNCQNPACKGVFTSANHHR